MVYPRRIRGGRQCIASNGIGRLDLVTRVDCRAREERIIRDEVDNTARALCSSPVNLERLYIYGLFIYIGTRRAEENVCLLPPF